MHSPNDTFPLDLAIGGRIQMRRKECGLSAEALAEKIGVSQQQLSRYERGENKISLAVLTQVADILQMLLHWFLLDVCPEAGHDSDALKARYDFHWSTFSDEQKQAIIRFLDTFNSGRKK